MKSHSKKRRALMAVLITFAILLVLLTATFFAPMFAILANEHTQISGDPQLMIVFGCDNDGYEMSSALKSRVDTALDYLTAHPTVRAILTGGRVQDKQVSEAECMRAYLAEHGVAADRLIVEDNAKDTVENVKYSLEIIAQQDLDTSQGVLLVSSEFHLARIKMLWKRAKGATPASTLAASSAPDKAISTIKESFVLFYIFLTAKF